MAEIASACPRSVIWPTSLQPDDFRLTRNVLVHNDHPPRQVTVTNQARLYRTAIESAPAIRRITPKARLKMAGIDVQIVAQQNSNLASDAAEIQQHLLDSLFASEDSSAHQQHNGSFGLCLTRKDTAEEVSWTGKAVRGRKSTAQPVRFITWAKLSPVSSSLSTLQIFV